MLIRNHPTNGFDFSVKFVCFFVCAKTQSLCCEFSEFASWHCTKLAEQSTGTVHVFMRRAIMYEEMAFWSDLDKNEGFKFSEIFTSKLKYYRTHCALDIQAKQISKTIEVMHSIQSVNKFQRKIKCSWYQFPCFSYHLLCNKGKKHCHVFFSVNEIWNFILFYCIVSLCKERCTTVHELSQLKKCENLIDYRVEWTELKSISTLRMIKVRQIFFFIFFVFLWFFPFFSIYPTFPDQKSDLIDFKVQIKVSKFEKTSLIAFQNQTFSIHFEITKHHP